MTAGDGRYGVPGFDGKTRTRATGQMTNARMGGQAEMMLIYIPYTHRKCSVNTEIPYECLQNEYEGMEWERWGFHPHIQPNQQAKYF